MNVRLLKFGEFSLDCARYELRKGGRAVKLEKIPMELLLLLATSEGRLVTREEIEERIWGKGVFVDAEHGINTAVRKVRQALGDDPDQPKFLQTVQRKGYRFIAEVKAAEEVKETGEAQSAAEVVPMAPSKASPSASATSEKASSQKRKWVWIAAAVVVLSAWPIAKFVASKPTRAEKEPTIQSIAVLPLENISGDADQEYFADGMTDELITMLAKYPSLRVISRTSVMQYKGVRRPLPEIAKELGVDGVIEGSVSRGNGRILVRAQLIYAPKETHLWAESYDRDLGDVLSLQQDLARNIAERVNRATSPAGTLPAPPHGSSNQAARDAYYRGRATWSAGPYKRSEEYFREAIVLDPNYAEAYAGLADSYTAAAVAGDMPPLEAMPKAEEAVRKALALREETAEVHHSNAAVKLFFGWDWETAEREIERALSLNPGIAEAHHLHSYILEAANRMEEALQEDKLCVELDPFGRSWSYGYALYRNRRYDEVIAEFEQRAELVPSGGLAYELMGLSYAHKGQYDKAVEEWRKRFEKEGQAEVVKKMQQAYREKGISGVWELRFRLQKENAAKEYVSPMHLAEAAADAGRREEALTYLEKAYEEHQPLMVRLLHDPELDELHGEPRFKALVKKMRLP